VSVINSNGVGLVLVKLTLADYCYIKHWVAFELFWCQWRYDG